MGRQSGYKWFVTLYDMGEPIEIEVDLCLFYRKSCEKTQHIRDNVPNVRKWIKKNRKDPIWPDLIEQAYAKLKGGYEKILHFGDPYIISNVVSGYPCRKVKLS